MLILTLIAMTVTSFIAEASVTKRSVRLWRTISYILGAVLVALLIAKGYWYVVVVVVGVSALSVALGMLASYIRTRRQGNEAE